MKIYMNNRGFTLIELLLVVGIVAIILAVIVPLGLRARIDAKYGVVRQNASELASFASQWVEKSIQAQDETESTATVGAYYASLANNAGTAAPTGAGQTCDGLWIAVQTANNWNLTDDINRTNTTGITGRVMNGAQDAAPEDCVEEIIPPDKAIRNPFTEVNVFRSPNLPPGTTNPVVGALALGCGVEQTGGWVYYAFAFQGTDSTTANLKGDLTSFHAGLGLTDIPGLRNGIFLGRFR